MGKNRDMEYRQDGIAYCYHFLKWKGVTIEDLEREVELRKETGVYVNLPMKDLNANEGVIVMMKDIYQLQDLLWCSALMKEGFRGKRLKRDYERVMQHRENNLIGACREAKRNDERLKKILHADDRYKVDPVDYGLVPSRHLQEYIDGRNAGIEAGIKIVKESGFYGLKKRMTRRSYLKNENDQEIVHADIVSRGHFNEASISEWLLAVHDLEGFGSQRLNRLMDTYERILLTIESGVLGFENLYIMVSEFFDIPKDIIEKRERWPAKEIVRAKKEERKKKEEESKNGCVINETDPLNDNAHEEEIVINEPDEYTSFPCPGCTDRSRCREQGYRNKCTCLALYKEIRRQNVELNKTKAS